MSSYARLSTLYDSITDLHDDSSLLRENHCTLERGTSPAVISGIDIITEEYNGAAKVIGKDKNLFDQLWDNDEYYERRNAGCPYYPFSGPVEWELVQWLQSLDIPISIGRPNAKVFPEPV